MNYDDLQYSDVINGIVFLSKRMNKEIPEWDDWSINDLKLYLKDVEIEFVQRQAESYIG